MPPKRKSKSPPSHGRQAKGRTIKSLSLDTSLVEWAEKLAQDRGVTFSELLSGILQDERSTVQESSPPYGSRKEDS